MHECNAKGLQSSSMRARKNGRADPLPLLELDPELFPVHSLLQFGPRGEFRDFASGDFDGCAGLRVAAVARLPLGNGESAEADQRHPVSLAESSSNAIDSSINGGRGLCFADFTCTCDLVDQISFIHSFSSQVSFVPSRNRDCVRLRLGWDT